MVTDPNLKTIATSYTPDDKVAAVIDPNNNTTSYTYNGFGEQTMIQSPDTGGTTMTYNEGGLIATKLDARGKTTSYTYVVLNRVTSVVYSDGSIAQTYDVGTSGVGRLSSVTDLSGSTTYTYDSYGRVASKSSFITGVPSNRVITYGRDTLGRVTSITYPGGNVVGMTYAQGRVTNMTLNKSCRRHGWIGAAVHGYLLGRDARTDADHRKAVARYVALVAAGKGVKLWEDALAKQMFLGDVDFIDRMQALIDPSRSGSKDIPKYQRIRSTHTIRHYLDKNPQRDDGIFAAAFDGQHSLTAIAKEVGLSISNVSRIMKKVEVRKGDSRRKA